MVVSCAEERGAAGTGRGKAEKKRGRQEERRAKRSASTSLQSQECRVGLLLRTRPLFRKMRCFIAPRVTGRTQEEEVGKALKSTTSNGNLRQEGQPRQQSN